MRSPVKSLEFRRRGRQEDEFKLCIRHSDAPDYHDAVTALPVPSTGSSAVPTSSSTAKKVV
jgi:hypothetical protein